MGIRFRGLAVGCPAGMADSGLAEQRRRFEPRFEIAQLAFGAAAAEYAVLHRRHSGRVVAAIFKPLERIDELASDRPFAEDANNAAHQPNSDSRISRLPT